MITLEYLTGKKTKKMETQDRKFKFVDYINLGWQIFSSKAGKRELDNPLDGNTDEKSNAHI